MSKYNAGTAGAKRKTPIGGQFSPRLIEMLESPAYRVLSQSAHRFISRLEIELAHHGGQDNGKLPCTFDDCQQYGIHRHAIGPAIREAVALGFVEVTEQGSAGNAEHRRPSLYRLTYRPAHGIPDDGSHEWRRIKTVEDAINISAMARKTIAPSRKKQKSNDGKRHVPNPEYTTESEIPQ